jgi:NIPSNAP protein
MKKSKSLFQIIPVLMFMLLISYSCKDCVQVSSPSGQEYYEIRIYSIADNTQESMVDAYLQDAYLPALHRAGIPTVGVFKPIETEKDFGKLLYVFIPFKTMKQYEQLSVILSNDQVYIKAGKDFLDAPYDNPPYIRYESILSLAFSYMPEFKAPTFTTPKSERIYEYRSYESATEVKADKKIHMFNEGGEMAIFEGIGANPVFFSKVLSGSQMPRLLYMTTYADMKSHDEKWDKFRSHPDWEKLKSMDEYQNTTSATNAFLLHPTSYSDF